jgi:hypothetical protein
LHLLLVCVVLADCGRSRDEDLAGPTPQPRVIDVLEAALSRFPCIGDIRKWERRYRFERNRDLYDPRRGEVSLNTIEFHLKRAGRFGVRPGRHISPPASVRVFELDDRPTDVAWGTYDVPTRTLKLTQCGPNV